jgi:mono/diheme cytochrome c family protein/cytochrome c2
LHLERISPFGPGVLRRFWSGRGGTVLATLAVVALSAAIGALGMIYSGVYNVSATEQHTAPVYWALETAMLKAVRRHARDIQAPPLGDPALIRRGFLIYRNTCVLCHGAPGVAPHDVGKGLLPVPNNLVQTAREWAPSELYWVTRHGLKMTGMPAWGMRFSEEELWAIVAFLKELPRLTAADYQGLDGSAAETQYPREANASVRAGDPHRGLMAMQQYACTTCHRIPGIVGAYAYVGPPLEGVASRKYLAGRLPTSPENLIRWIRDPKSVSPTTLMPDLKVSEEHARDMAAYLYTLK